MPDEEPVEVTGPYPGLRSFARHEAGIFFGREQHVDRLLGILQRERFLAVIGESGSGKSSLVRAGLLPGLAAGWLATGSDWRIAEMRPGHRPIRALARALLGSDALGAELGGDAAAGDATTVAHIEAELRRGPRGLSDLTAEVRRTAGGPTRFNLLVLVDQFEELFRYRERGSAQADEAEAFVDLLLTGRTVGDGLYVAITMRSDFLGPCARFPGLAEAINHAQYLTPRLARGELEAAITKPARLFGGSLEPALVNELINGAANDQDQLPIIQHALAVMWDAARARDPDRPAIGMGDVGEAGITGLLSKHADAVLGGLTTDQTRTAEVLFRTITERGGLDGGWQDTRRPTKVAEIAAIAERAWGDVVPVIRAFASEGVNVVVHTLPLDEDSRIDISHEALIRRWERLQGWVADEAERAGEYRRWRDRAAEWQRGGELLTGADLARAVEWRAGREGWRPGVAWATRYRRGDAAQEFALTLECIARSEERQQALERAREMETQGQLVRERLRLRHARRLTVAASVLAIGAVGFGMATYESYQDAQNSRAAVKVSLKTLQEVNRTLQESNRKIEAESRNARAQSLASKAMLQQSRDPDRALGLSIKAYRLSPNEETGGVLLRMLSGYDRLIAVLQGPAVGGSRPHVYHASFDPAGGRVVVTTTEVTSTAWDGNGHRLGDLPAGKAGAAPAVFSPDGTRLATAGSDGMCWLWSIRNGEFTPLASRKGLAPGVRQLVFSADGRSLLAIGRDGAVTLWNTRRGDTVVLDEQGVNDAAFSPDGSLIVTGARNGRMRLWTPAGKLQSTLHAGDKDVARVQFSADGAFLATAAGALHVWDSRTWVPTRLGQDGDVQQLAVSRDGRFIVSVGSDLNLWSRADQWKAAKGFKQGFTERRPTAVAFSPDGEAVVVTTDDGVAWMFETASRTRQQMLRTHEGKITHAAYSPDGRVLVTTGQDGTARLWRVGPPEVRKLAAHGLPRFAPDGTRFVTLADRVVVLWDAAGRELARMAGHAGPVSHAGFSADGQQVITASLDGAVRVWDLGGRLVRTLGGHEGGAVHAAWVGSRVVSIDARATLRSWGEDGRPAGSPVRLSEDGPAARPLVIVSPDGGHVVTVGADGDARLWSSAGKLLQTFDDYRGNIAGAVFSPDGSLLVTIGKPGAMSALWDATGGRRAEFTEAGPVQQAAFNAGATMIVTTGHDHRVHLWDTASGRLLQKPSRGESVYATFSPVTGILLTVGRDGRIRLWHTGGDRDLLSWTPAGTVDAVSVSPDGRQLAAASPGGLFLRECWLCAPLDRLIADIGPRVPLATAEEDAAPREQWADDI